MEVLPGVVIRPALRACTTGSQLLECLPRSAKWFQIGRLLVVGGHPVLEASQMPTAIAAGPDGTVWFTVADTIGRLSDGRITFFHTGIKAIEPGGCCGTRWQRRVRRQRPPPSPELPSRARLWIGSI